MTVTLTRGENTTLPHRTVSITATGVTPGTVDLLVFQLGMNQKARTDDDLIFFNAPISKEGAVTLSGDRVDVSLDRVPSDVRFLRVAVALDESAGRTLAAIKGLGAALTDPSGTHIVIEWPEMRFLCTVMLARRALSLPTYRLPYVLEALGGALVDHDESLADVRAVVNTNDRRGCNDGNGILYGPTSAMWVPLENQPSMSPTCAPRQMSDH